MSFTETFLAHIPNNPLPGLRALDQRWQQWRAGIPPQAAQVITTSTESLGELDWDVVICGGTLGILLGAALTQKGWRVALLEKGVLQGRAQEWNTSAGEFSVLTRLGLLTAEQFTQAIASEFNPNRIAFHGGTEFWVKDVLNIGIDPVYLLDTLKQTFLHQGGTLLEQTGFTHAIIHPDGVKIHAGADVLNTRLLIDAMGHYSPMVAQARAGKPPDAACLVVGTCAQGIPRGTTGDLMVSLAPTESVGQCFWEAFPAREGRTTYLFTYADLHPKRPSLEELFEVYFQTLGTYQQTDLGTLQILRALFGIFPSYQKGPLVFPWSRTLAVGDSSGCQSPLSFGGFGAMLRHLPRLAQGLHEALSSNALSQQDMALLQPYQPNLSVTWLFQRAMSIRGKQTLPPNQINTLLNAVFQSMDQLGPPVLNPFLQDVVQFGALYRTLMQVSRRSPHLIPAILQQVGAGALLDWMRHFGALGFYTAVCAFQQKEPNKHLSPEQLYRRHRRQESFLYGAGKDHLSKSTISDSLLEFGNHR
jgi:lycopene cyclase CruP